MAKGVKTGGRVAGTQNKATAELREAARIYTDTALKELARLAVHAASEAARVAACRELLDRGHGRAPQGITVGSEDETSPALIISWGNPTN